MSIIYKCDICGETIEEGDPGAGVFMFASQPQVITGGQPKGRAQKEQKMLCHECAEDLKEYIENIEKADDIVTE